CFCWQTRSCAVSAFREAAGGQSRPMTVASQMPRIGVIGGVGRGGFSGSGGLAHPLTPSMAAINSHPPNFVAPVGILILLP
ncbi:TPA: hypothetical protein ACKPXW_005178, partial [Serratia marcescens]